MKLNEATVNKSHDDVLIEYLKNISTETITSFVVILHSHFSILFILKMENVGLSVDFH
jgi:penicillin-binding protein-related factor A (putative recombinase)